MLIEATTGFRPNGVEFVRAEVRKHSGELSNACDFSVNHHRESSPGIITGLDLKGLFPKGFAVREKAKRPKLELLRLFRQKNRRSFVLFGQPLSIWLTILPRHGEQFYPPY